MRDRRRALRSIAAAVGLTLAAPTALAACGSGGSDPYPLASVALTTLDGAHRELQPPFGQPVLVNLWAVWCAPCRREFPLLDEAAADWGDRAEVIGVNTDGRSAAVREFVDDSGVTYEQLIDAERESLVRFGIAALPATVALRTDGTVAAVHRGEVSRADLDELLAAASEPAA